MTWEDFERLARDDLRHRLGRAELTGAGADAGVDIRSPGWVAQVKAMLRPAGRPDLQRLVGAATGDRTAFYSLGGFSYEANKYADQVGMALFEFTIDGQVLPVNGVGSEMGLAPEEREVIEEYRELRDRNMPPDWTGDYADAHCPFCGRSAEEFAETNEPQGVGRFLMRERSDDGWEMPIDPWPRIWVCDVDESCLARAEDLLGRIHQTFGK